MKTHSGSNKIADHDLLEFLQAKSDEATQVLLEVEAPEPVVFFRKDRSPEGIGMLPDAVEYGSASAETAQKAVEATRSLLESMDIGYRFSKNARVFAVGVTPNQLKALVALRLIKSVVPNRSIKI